MVWRFVIWMMIAGLIWSDAPLVTQAEARTDGTEKAYALVIGIDAYRAGWPRLDNAVNDARAVAAALDDLGFEVETHADVTGEELHRLLLEFFVIKGADPHARLLLWYAGHGETIDGEGYLVPRDAPISARPEFLLSAIPVRMLGSFVRLAQARHVLAVFDSCFAGTIFESRSGPSAALRTRIDEPVREFLTSGDAGQRVRDDGSFKDYFLRALTQDIEADFNADGLVTGSELGLFLSQQITTLTAFAQTPQYGKLHDTRFNRGDFYFSVGRDRTPAPPAADREALFWESIKWSSSRAEYQAYLARFPNGFYKPLAEERIARLAATAGPARVDGVPIWPLDQAMVVAAGSRVNVRRAPDQGAERVASLAAGTEVTATGKLADSPWFRVRLPDGGSGFLLSTYLEGLTDSVRVTGPRNAPSIHATFGPPVNEALTVPVDLSKREIRHTAYLRNGAIVWLDGDIYGDEIGLSIYVDSPRHSMAPTFRHVLDISSPSSVKLENLTPDPVYNWGGIVENEYKTLRIQVEFVAANQ